MAEEVKETNTKSPLLDAFMKAGKISVFESGLDRPDHLQDRPFMQLLPHGKVSFVNMSEIADKLYVKNADEMAADQSLDTEAHQFFQNLEKRFRTVAPGVTIFIIDPDAIQGRYLMDQSPDRSLNKSLYMYVEDKLQKASAGDKKTFLTHDQVLNNVNESGVSGRNPFSMRAVISPTAENLAGLGNVNLVIGDNPDAMEACIFGDEIVGAEQRRLKEGISRDEFRRLVVYHELGHATDNNYASSFNSIEKITKTELDTTMDRHRTECVADAHAVLQLARDFGNTKCAELWGDCRMEFLRISVENRFDEVKYDNDFMKALREADKKTHALNPADPDYENKFKQVMADKNVATTIDKLATPLAYHTTDVIDATVKWAKEHLADGSLQKMTDAEVIKQAQVMSETYGLTRQQMAELSLSLAKGEKNHPKYEQMMARVQEGRARMPVDVKVQEKQYELRRELRAYRETAGFYAGLGLPVPDIKTSISKDLLKKLAIDQVIGQKKRAFEQMSVDQYQQDLLDKLEKTASREEMRVILGQEKEALRAAGKNDKGKKDPFAGTKLKVVDSVIAEAPNVEAIMATNKVIKKQLADIKSTTEVSGGKALVHFIKNELREAASMSKALYQAFNRKGDQTPAEQLSAMRSEYKEFKKAMIAEKETQIAAFAIRSDKETWAQVSADPILSMLIDQKAKQKPDAVLAQYQMNMGSMSKEIAATLFQDVSATHKYLVETFTGNAASATALKENDTRMFDTMKKYADSLKTTDTVSPLNLKNFKIAEKKTVLEQILNSKKQRS